MFNSSYGSSRTNLFATSTRLHQKNTIEYFDDQDLSALQFWILVGICVSFLVLVLTVISIIAFYELCIENKNLLNEEHAAQLEDLKNMTGLKIQLNDIRSIMMNEIILKAWKREKDRRRNHSSS